MTTNSGFKGTPLFDDKYLRNDTRQMHGYYRPLIGACGLLIVPSPMTLIDIQCHFSYFCL